MKMRSLIVVAVVLLAGVYFVWSYTDQTDPILSNTVESTPTLKTDESEKSPLPTNEPDTEKPTIVLPTHDEYPVQDVFSGVSAPLNLKSHTIGLRYRTRISEGYKGGANFAGHYTIAIWGCGMDCQSLAIIDNANGKIYGSYITEKLTGGHGSFSLDFNINSTLLVINPQYYLDQAESEPADSGPWLDEESKHRYFQYIRDHKDSYPTKYYKWEKNELVLIDTDNPVSK
jgi:hypothetical protein